MLSIEQVKQALVQIEAEKRYLNSLESSIARYRNRLESPPLGAGYNQTARVQNSTLNRFEEHMAALLDLEEIYNTCLARILRREVRVYKAIRELDIQEQNIIIEKYIHGMTWIEVAEKVSYSQSQTIRKAKKAMQKLVGKSDFIKNVKDDNK